MYNALYKKFVAETAAQLVAQKFDQYESDENMKICCNQALNVAIMLADILNDWWDSKNFNTVMFDIAETVNSGIEDAIYALAKKVEESK